MALPCKHKILDMFITALDKSTKWSVADTKRCCDRPIRGFEWLTSRLLPGRGSWACDWWWRSSCLEGCEELRRHRWRACLEDRLSEKFKTTICTEDNGWFAILKGVQSFCCSWYDPYSEESVSRLAHRSSSTVRSFKSINKIHKSCKKESQNKTKTMKNYQKK